MSSGGARDKMSKLPMIGIALAAVLLTPSCGTLPLVPADTALAPPEQVADLPVLPTIITTAHVEQALSDLTGPRAISVTYTVTNNEEGIQSIDRVTTNADRSVALVWSDHTDQANQILSQLEDAAKAEAESDADESFLSAWAAVAGTTKEPVAFIAELTDGENGLLWFTIGDLAAAERGEAEAIDLLMGEPDDSGATFASTLQTPPAELNDRWVSSTWYEDERQLYPTTQALSVLAGLGEIVEQFGLDDAGFVAEETGRTDTTATFRLSPASGSGDDAWLATLDGNLDIIRLDNNRDRIIEFSRDVDAESITPPAPEDRVTEAELATWLGQSPCGGDEMYVFSIRLLQCPA